MAWIADIALLAIVAFLAGLAGSYLGIGGGVFLIPFMTLVLQVPIKVAIATSLIGVIATSSGAASVYVRDHLTNLRLAMALEVATTLGAVAGAVVGLLVREVFLYIAFGVVVLYVAATMVRVRETARQRAYRTDIVESKVSKRLRLDGVYFDREDQGVYRYRVERPVAGFAASAAAGVFSGLLGIGGGFIKVPAMNILMKVPMKPAVATSNFMIGVTAAASAFIYYSEGLVNPGLAAMVIIGVFSGTNIGTRLMEKAKASRVRVLFAACLTGLGIAMIARLAFPGVPI